MNAIAIPPTFQGGPAAIFGGAGYDDDLGASISAGFSLIGYRGKTWSIRHQGTEQALLRGDGSGDPLNSIDLVILKAPNHLSKVWYETGWQEGSAERPDCASSNGEVPDAGVPKRQNDVCLTCKWNQFGSRPAQPGQTQQFKGKACGDNKRLAVVPLGDIANERYGGPMLLRVPAASLGDVQALSMLLKQLGFPYYAVGLKVAFDTTVSYPKFIFKPLRPLSEEEGKIVLELRENPLTDTICHGDTPPAPTPQQAKTASAAAASKPDNVVPMQPAQPPPTQQAGAAQAPTGFGGVAAAAPASQTPAPKPASAGAFGGGDETGEGQPPATENAQTTGVAQFDAAFEKKLEGLL